MFNVVVLVLGSHLFMSQVESSSGAAARVADWRLWLAETGPSSPPPSFNPWQAQLPQDSPARLHKERPSLYWTRTSLDLIVKYQLNPLRASRVLALLHVAMNDALVRGVRGSGDEQIAWVAVNRAASLTLADLFPQEPAERYEAKGLVAAAVFAGEASLPESRLRLPPPSRAPCDRNGPSRRRRPRRPAASR